jgi:N utilization substance protein B
MSKRRSAREYCLQVLYLADIGNLNYRNAASLLFDLKCSLDHKTAHFADTILEGTLKNSAPISEAITKYAKNWTMERMSKVDRCILRFASFELLYMPETPIAAIIDEAIEIAKKYSTEKSSKFINGVLDKVKNERKVTQSK